MHLKLRPVSLLCAVLLSPWLAGQTIYVDVDATVEAGHAPHVVVDVDATGANNGSSWANAYTDLQDGLLASSTGQIWVAEGVYHPSAIGDVTASYQLKDGVELYGGFDGSEVLLAQRDVAAHPTILSGDLTEDDTYGSGISWWRFGWTGSGNNSGRIVDGSGVGASAVIDGFTVFAGFGGNSPSGRGAGMFIQNGSPRVRNCTFQYNSYANGASVYIEAGAPVFEGCLIRDGYTFGRTASGVYSLGSVVSFTDCEFLNHYTVTLMGGNDGSAVFADFNSDTSFLRCDFVGNQVGNWFAMGDPSGSHGGGIENWGTLAVDACRLIDNYAHAGAGISTHGPTTIVNSLFRGNFAHPYPVNPVVDDGDFGAGLSVLTGAGETVSVVNCSFADNYCDKGAGLAAYSVDPVQVQNCIVFHNNGPAPLPGEDEVPHQLRQMVGNYDLADSCVEEIMQRIPGEDPVESTKYPGCFDQDPRFVDLAAGDFHLQSDSPCINSGNDSWVPVGTTTDLDGNPRFGLSSVDMGVFEFAGTPVPSLVATTLVTEIEGAFTVHNAQPGESVFFVYTLTGLGAGPTIGALGGRQLGLLPPIAVLLAFPADGAGQADLRFVMPPAAPTIDIFLQAAMVRGPGGTLSALTKAVGQTIHLKP